MVESVIKWFGSKKSQADEIIKYIPREIDTYYEPFCGGAAILHRLLSVSDTIKVKHYVASDLNGDLINSFNLIKTNPYAVVSHYKKLWNEFNVNGNNLDYRKKYFDSVRDRYNKEHNALDFIFIMRTCANGMPRYNKNGDFNCSCNRNRTGVKIETFYELVYHWSKLYNLYDVEFRHCSYDNIIPNSNDFCYFDPPYEKIKSVYFGNIDLNNLWEYLRKLECKWLLSFDGVVGDADISCNVPTDIYSKQLFINNNISRFRAMVGKNEKIYDSLYISK
jgi:DNA adenine methylase